MSDKVLNLSGRWDGTFGYPGGALPTTPFLAAIDETDGILTGTTIEPDLYRSAALHAGIRGHRAGRLVDFTKIYDRDGEEYSEPIDYVGQLSADGQTVTGSWTMQDWSGWFEMTREELAEVAVEAKATVEVG